MKVVLLKNINSLGDKGDIKDVSDGYAVNFLIPQKYALVASSANISRVNGELNKKSKDIKIKESEYGNIKKTLNKQTIELSGKVSNKDNLFQGISRADIIQAVKEKFNLEISEKWFKENVALKKIGRHPITLTLPNKDLINFFINIKPL